METGTRGLPWRPRSRWVWWWTASERGLDADCSTRSDGRDPRLTQVELGQFAARGGARLGEDVTRVEGDGARRNPALGGDFLVGLTRTHQLGDLQLGRGELDQRGR